MNSTSLTSSTLDCSRRFHQPGRRGDGVFVGSPSAGALPSGLLPNKWMHLPKPRAPWTAAYRVTSASSQVIHGR